MAPNLPPPTQRGHRAVKSRDAASPRAPAPPRPPSTGPSSRGLAAGLDRGTAAAGRGGAALPAACPYQSSPSRPDPAPGAAQGLPSKKESDGHGPTAASTYPTTRRHVEGAGDKGTETVARWRRAVKRGSPPEYQRVPAALA